MVFKILNKNLHRNIAKKDINYKTTVQIDNKIIT